MKKPHWKEEEIELLKKYYETGDKQLLIKVLKSRGWSGIQHKAQRLGLRRIRRCFQPRRLPELSHDDKLYLSGLIDGDGCITVTFQRSRRSTVLLTPLVTITGTSINLFLWLKPVLKGTTLKTHEESRKRKDRWTIQVARVADVKALLQQIIPYLKAKKEQAELVLEFCDEKLKTPTGVLNPRLIELVRKIQALNKKGKTIRHQKLFKEIVCNTG